MALDLRTIYAVASLTLFMLGAIQFAAYATGRFQRWPLWWSASNILTGLGCLLVALRGVAADVVSVDLGNAATLAGYILMLVAVRVFAGRKTALRYPVLAIAGGSLAIVLFLGGAEEAMGRVALASAIMCAVDLAILREGWRLAKREKLYSAWILVALYLPTSAIFATRGTLALTGHLGGTELFGNSGHDPHAWLALTAVTFVLLRSMVMLMMAAERGHCELTRLALHDPLTVLLNRARLTRSFETLDRPSLLLFDIDHFKALNDRHGHAAGDDALRLFAETAAAQLGAGDLLGRLGGDEFVAVLDKAPIEDAVAVAGRIQQAFARAIAQRPDLSIHPTLSIGIARAASPGTPLAVLLQEADAALYRCKRDGRDRVAVSDAHSLAA